MNVQEFEESLESIMEKLAKSDEPLLVDSPKGNVVVLSESSYRSMKETLYLMSQPGVREELLKSKDVDPNECVEYDPSKRWRRKRTSLVYKRSKNL
jgi:PHD/YefM family antitoxin component YafN of YafNO toxin-antitoxin module